MDTLDEPDAGYYELLVVITPEPTTLSMLALGGLAVLRRRQQRA